MPKKVPAKKTTVKKATKKTVAKKPTTKKPTIKKSTVKKATPQIKNSVKGKKEKFTFGKFLAAVCFIILPLIVGFASAAITGKTMMEFGLLNQPEFTPSVCTFPIVWTILYILMGVASYLVYKFKPQNPVEESLRKSELTLYFIQLIFNFCWAIFFFRLELRFFAFGWLIGMWLIIFTLIFMCFKNRKSAAWLLLPYLLWCTYAAYLNIMIAILN